MTLGLSNGKARHATLDMINIIPQGTNKGGRHDASEGSEVVLNFQEYILLCRQWGC